MLFTANPLFRLVQQQHVSDHPFLNRTVRRATVEGLVLLKLYALPSLYSQGDTQRIALYETDVTMLVDRYRPGLQPLLQALQPHLDRGAFMEVEHIVSEIQGRVARMDARKQSPAAG